MTDKQKDELIDRALNEEQVLPDGLSERLERHIDTLPDEAQSKKKFALFSGHSLYWISSFAAALLVGLILFFQIEHRQPVHIADTYTDPKEAAVAAQKALELISSQLNKGLEPLAHAGHEMEKINEVLTKKNK